MIETGRPAGVPRAALGALGRLHRAGRRPGTPSASAEADACPALADMYERHYGPLLRVAALLTGDDRTAEAVVVEAFSVLCWRGMPITGSGDSLACLHRLLVAQVRRAAARRPPPSSQPLTRALRALPAGQREAVVLTLYLDLTAEQAAAAMRVSPAAFGRYLAAGMAALSAGWPAGP
jgi:DNA-directed RNA polymerase specialized sigma24 family protein